MLSKTAEYALRVMAGLAAENEQARGGNQIAEQTKVPRRYLNKVLKDLVDAGLVHSRTGPGGGYSLAQAPDSISILDVVNAVSPVERIRHCPLGLKSHTSLCPLHAELDRAYAATEAAFAGVTLDQVLKSAGKIQPLCEVADD
ncbi:Rrf2 family transcriptional regulator [Rubinisphaera margarita]|uniref:Rrf2 family transcriptional regulator n=1 Tax=Rubinisphaera margarita TaxID=2909586 RepID=UPI001EE8380E|nr:Rrf2 family transcriptional regulator [Rubinisphaera margarita]MCG6154593.1 Rrf2 family transcriptional regulator [Rubinisphaera margarita]